MGTTTSQLGIGNNGINDAGRLVVLNDIWIALMFGKKKFLLEFLWWSLLLHLMLINDCIM